ncbi:unnamed protein product, partial [Staurois parvus]
MGPCTASSCCCPYIPVQASSWAPSPACSCSRIPIVSSLSWNPFPSHSGCEFNFL